VTNKAEQLLALDSNSEHSPATLLEELVEDVVPPQAVNKAAAAMAVIV